MNRPSRSDRLAGGLLGLLVGDALGVPYEFHSAAGLPAAHEIEYEPPPGFARAHAGVAPGTWSDDGAQALCLLESLLECRRFDIEDFARRLLRWYEEGHLAVDGVVFDIGITSGIAIRALRAGTPAEHAGPADTGNKGNGSLMRALPLALWHQGSDADLVRDAQLQSRVTHGHLCPQVCCALYCLWARRVLEGADNPWESATSTLRTMLQSNQAALEELEWSIRPDEEIPGQGSGYVVDSLRSARQSLRCDGYAQAVRAAISLGRDTDTTACITGGVAGLRDGIQGIPLHWRDKLRGGELYMPLLERLLQHDSALPSP